MNADHLQFAQESLASFIDAAIQRIAISGDLVYRYTISANSIKGAAGLTRLKAAVIQDYINYFQMMGVAADYNEAFDLLSITLNMNSCVLTPLQSDMLAIAMSTYRAENM